MQGNGSLGHKSFLARSALDRWVPQASNHLSHPEDHIITDLFTIKGKALWRPASFQRQLWDHMCTPRRLKKALSALEALYFNSRLVFRGSHLQPTSGLSKGSLKHGVFS